MPLKDLPEKLKGHTAACWLARGKAVMVGAGIGSAVTGVATGGSVHDAISNIISSLFGLF